MNVKTSWVISQRPVAKLLAVRDAVSIEVRNTHVTSSMTDIAYTWIAFSIWVQSRHGVVIGDAWNRCRIEKLCNQHALLDEFAKIAWIS